MLFMIDFLCVFYKLWNTGYVRAKGLKVQSVKFHTFLKINVYKNAGSCLFTIRQSSLQKVTKADKNFILIKELA